MSRLQAALRLAARADATFAAGRLVAALPLYIDACTQLEMHQGKAPKALARGFIRLALCRRAAGSSDAAVVALERAVDVAEAAGLPGHLAEACRLLAAVAEQRSALGDAERWLRRALAAYTEQGSAAGAAATLCAMGRVCRGSGDLETARDRFEQAEAISARAGHLVGRADALANLGNLFRVQSDLASAQAAFDGVLAAARAGTRSGGPPSEKTALEALERRALSDLGNVAAARGERSEAIALYHEARELQRDAGDVVGAASNTCNLASLWSQSGRLAQAAGAYREALSVLEAGGAPARVVIDVSLMLAQTLARMGQLAASDELLLNALAQAQELDYVDGERRLAATLAARDLIAGRVSAARERHGGIVAAVRNAQVPADEVAVLLTAVDADLAAQEYGVARARLERAAHLVHSHGLIRYQATLEVSEAHLRARGQTALEAVPTLLAAAEQLDALDLPVEALATRLCLADYHAVSDPGTLVEAAQALGAEAAALEARSLVALQERAGPAVFLELADAARERRMGQLAAQIDRRNARINAPGELPGLAALAQARGALWEARLCLRQGS